MSTNPEYFEDGVMMLMLEAEAGGLGYLLDGLETGEVDMIYEIRFKILGEE